jgi:TolA-binding protein
MPERTPKQQKAFDRMMQIIDSFTTEEECEEAIRILEEVLEQRKANRPR